MEVDKKKIGIEEERIITKVIRIKRVIRNKKEDNGIYINRDLEKKIDLLKDWIEEKERKIKTIISGDFNTRTGEKERRR